jgi:signal transduction histidine kinase
MTEQSPEFRLLFEASPEVLLVLLPDAPRFTIVAATRSRLLATQTTYEQNIGSANLLSSLQRVMATRAADTMAVQRYDIRTPDGSFQTKYWSPKNLPVLGSGGELRYILHRVEDVTELVQASERGEVLRDRNRQMEQEVISRSRELASAIRELREANAKLGELDAAKTAFFSNVSHEFRTPLTLMLGPLADALADTAEPLGPQQGSRLRMAHDNALRLSRLVNSLLDFSRLEAGRLHVRYAPLDIAGFTAKLAGMFQSAVEKAGLHLRIDCPGLSEPVWVDRDMWEKIVPNLVSNALKFTHAGSITVAMREEEHQVVLLVSDTGIGIPENEIPHIFERFHRVSGVSGRTYEGTGIGLSLVRELTELHGGTVSVESVLGKGTTFRVAIPTGYAHLPPDAVSHEPIEQPIGRDTAAQVAEAARWDDRSTACVDTMRTGALKSSGPRSQVLVVDDNADLREYLSILLSPYYDVATATDGLAALDVMQVRTPDIVVSDVMMPRLDGFGLVRALRARPETMSLPVILLSARAGEESAIDGLDAGSDDYLIKPFSARELLARVRTHLQLSQARRAWTAELERANRELDAFSYSVSHDLRSPLRAVDGFSQILKEEYAHNLDERAHSYLDNIRSSVQHMGMLIEALLDLARIGRTALNADRVDLSVLAEEVIADLRQAHPQRQVHIDVEKELVTHGDRNLLKVVLVNLLSNAWKFTARRSLARIEFFRHHDSAFVIRDNGAGFDMAQAARLFVPFNRLHSQREFRGTGIGLTTVQRVIERHGGRVWVDAKPGEGASFFFSLPQN